MRPLVHDHVIANISEGYILLDSDRRLIDANHTAMRYFPELKKLLPGGPIAAASSFPRDILDWPYLNHEFPLQINETDEVILRAYISPIGRDGRVMCTSIILSEVTEPAVLKSEQEAKTTHDSVTNVLSHSTFFLYASLYFNLLLRMNQPITVMTLELDHFHRLNDQFGQLTSDDALRDIAAILKKRLRRTDLCGRYDQTKLCVFLPAASIKNARRLADRIRLTIAGHSFESQANPMHDPRQIRFFTGPSRTFRATVSIGLAELDSGKHFTLDELFTDADVALSMAKDSGHNTVVAI